ncbi:MAG: peptide chain release factor 2 [Candidatus Omnitrophota bacterium]
MFDVIIKQIQVLEEKLAQLRGFLDLPKKCEEIASIQEQMSQPTFWNDGQQANQRMRELKILKSTVEPFQESVSKLSELKELAEISQDDPSLLGQISKNLEIVSQQINEIEIKAILGGEFDKNNAILSINAGAGGTESCDWANMLLRMYTRWAEDKEFKVKILDILPGEEAGVKNATVSIIGDMAYGLLKSERGVHRLVRISPFDSNKRRHTSFVSVDVIPEIEDDISIEIDSDDLRIDIFRSSGPGGQSVNTTDSAVRMTHIPTGVVVQCQNERSQLQNRQMAMRILRARLYEKKQKEKDEKMAAEYGQKQKIEWGSQIRSYVLQPYSLVKDHRTDTETGNVQRVLEGDINLFIEAFLRTRKK